MNKAETAIWRNKNNNSPIGTIDGVSIVNKQSESLSEVYIFFEVNDELRAVFDSIFLLNLWESKKRLLITQNKLADFQKFFDKYNIQNRIFFYKLIGLLNNELSFCRQIEKTSKQQEIDEAPIKRVFEEYQENFTDNSYDIEFNLNSISFRFRDKSRWITIDDQTVISKVLEALLLHYKFSYSPSFSLPSHELQKRVAFNMFEIFRDRKNSIFYAKSKNAAYQIIEDIFDLSDFEVSFDAIKQWFKRRNQHSAE